MMMSDPVALGGDESEDLQYRAIHAGAIASIVFGALSTLVFVAGRDSLSGFLMMAPLPAIGLAVGLVALKRIRSNPDHWTGKKLAVAGVALSAACLFGGLGFSSYVYATEVPPGYARTSFADMRPDEVEQRGNTFIPRDIEALDGKKVFIKGYIRPDSTPYSKNINKFLLVRDNMQCCFGDISTVNYFDQMAVTLADKTVDYNTGVFRIGGVLHLHPHNIDRRQPVFTLDADYAK